MVNKLRILFYNTDGAGINYYRTITPATEIERNYSDDIFVEISHGIDFNNPDTINYLKTFNIIHYHRQLHPDINEMKRLVKELKNSGVILILDIDDYWELHEKHPYYGLSVENNLANITKQNILLSDYVTTTTDYFANEICKITGINNVCVLPNAINPEWMRQFQSNWKPDPDGRIRITYMAGSCYDDKTEVLTNVGWKLFKYLNGDETIATLNPNNNQLEYQKPISYIIEPYIGEMYYGESEYVDFAVTPNHNMYVAINNQGDDEISLNHSLNRMENIDTCDLIFQKNCKWIGVDDEYFIVPNDNNNDGSEIKFQLNDWIKIFGFWLGDGWLSLDDGCVGLCGYREMGIRTIKELHEILNKYNIHSELDENELRIFNKSILKYLNELGGTFEKFIPEEILNTSTNTLKLLFEYYSKTDGHVDYSSYCGYTTSKKLVNNWIEIGLKIGIQVSCVYSRIINNEINSKDLILDDQKNNMFGIRFSISNNNDYPILLNQNIKKNTYVGNIYCVTVPNHIIYVRRNGKSYWCGNSHMVDVQQLTGVVNSLYSDSDVRDKFKIIIAGWDTEGSTFDVTFNQEFGNEMQNRKLLTPDVIKSINKSGGDVNRIYKIPLDLKEKYRNNIFIYNKRDIQSSESIYYIYEKILTDNHNIITNKNYLQWLMNFERNVEYPDEGNFGRRWTQKANIYAKVLDETDIVIAPLSDNKFNRCKCVIGNTLINTNKGLIKIRDLVDRRYDELKIMNNNVTSYFKYEGEKTIKLITDIGIEIEGTPTHRLFVDGRWKTISEFIVGDIIEFNSFEYQAKEYQKILFNDSNETQLSIIFTETYGRFFGYLIGGVINVEYLIEYLSNYIGGNKEVEIREYVEKYITNNVNNLEVPEFILMSPKSVIWEFLLGIFGIQGEMVKDNSSIYLSSNSLNLIKQIQILLLGFGVVGRIDNESDNNYKFTLCGESVKKLYNGFEIVQQSNQINDGVIKFESKVVEIISGVNDVYDVEVEHIHKYVGNGIINHNSNLKQVECWSRKLPIVCSDIPPYNVDGRHMENCVLVSLKPSEKHAHKDWKKYLKRLILDGSLRNRLGEQLYEDFKEKYNLKNVTEKRVDFYKKIIINI